MEGEWMRFWCLALTGIFFQEVTGLNMRNEHVGKCVQVQESHGRVTLEECETDSGLQEWHWNSDTRSFRNPQTGTCLTAVNIQEHEDVVLQVCRPEEEVLAWVCSRTGHVSLDNKGFYLSAHPDSSQIFLSVVRGKVSKWRTLGKKTVCEKQPDSFTPKTQSEPENTGPRIITDIRLWHSLVNHGLAAPKTTQPAHITFAVSQLNSSLESAETSLNLLNMEYGMEWKVTMLVLSCLALLLGVTILILNIYQNGRKNTVVVFKSCSPTEQTSQPGSPVPSERAPLTKHAMSSPTSSSMQHGEILIEWKDGTVTQLFDTHLTS